MLSARERRGLLEGTGRELMGPSDLGHNGKKAFKENSSHQDQFEDCWGSVCKKSGAAWIRTEVVDWRDEGGCGDEASVAPSFCMGAKGDGCITN